MKRRPDDIDLDQLLSIAVRVLREAGGKRTPGVARELARALDEAIALPGLWEVVDGPIFMLLATILLGAAEKVIAKGVA